MTASSIAYRVLVPGQRHFDCEALRATLDTRTCASRWQSAAPGTQCHGCEIGRAHAALHHPQPDLPTTPRRAGEGACLRCGRTDLRLVRRKAVCVSCFNREGEWRKGRNSRGTPPRDYEPLRPIQMAVHRGDGSIEHRRINALHAAEAACLASRGLAPGEALAEVRQGASTWNAKAQRFEHSCTRCAAPGMLERVNAACVVRYQCPACDGAPGGEGWQVARVRATTTALTAGELEAWLNACEPDAPVGLRWAATEYVCANCRRSPLEARKQTGGWRARCPECEGVSPAPPLHGPAAQPSPACR